MAVDPSVRFVDVGGITPFGRSVRQFTPTVDRAFWGLGSRTADPLYDLMAVALSLLQLEQPLPADLHRLTPDERKRWLAKALKRYPGIHRAKVLSDVLSGKTDTAGAFGRRWQEAWQRDRVRKRCPRTTVATPPASPKAGAAAGTQQSGAASVRQHPRKPKRDWSEWLMWYSLSLAVIVTGVACVTAIGWLP